MEQIKKIFNDVLYVSKLTGTKNKKITIFFAVVLSQLTAFTDVLIIILFVERGLFLIQFWSIFLPKI